MQKRRPKRKRKDVLQIQKSMHKESLAVRAGSVRPRGLAVMIKSMHLNRPAFTAAADKICTRTKKKGQKKAKKRHRRAKSPGLAARQGSGGREVVAASAAAGAGLGVHFMPAASRRQRGQRLKQAGQPCIHTFCRQDWLSVSA